MGDEEHSGWLPERAATPERAPNADVLLNLTISSDGNGYILEWTDRDRTHHGDTWHETLDDAMNQAKYYFGIEAAMWEDV
ncbi:MAG: hypothetical protein HC801_07455 [Nitrospira sp.]|nr:hypothetical protein [Nitrospira sp.]